MKVRQGYKFALRARPGDRQRFASGAGGSRFAYNWGLGRIHARAANVRAGALHKATTDLAARYATVVAEDLNVTGMTSNRSLARAISDQGSGTARADARLQDGA